MACCRQGSCPMHESKFASGLTRTITQTEADTCCASSESTQSEQTAPVMVTTLPPLELVTGLFSSLVSAALTFDASRDPVPLVSNEPRTHLLLSVFLI
jgi:hypothetical protein